MLSPPAQSDNRQAQLISFLAQALKNPQLIPQVRVHAGTHRAPAYLRLVVHLS